MGLPSAKKNNKESINKNLQEPGTSSSENNYLDKFFGDVSKTSATKQIVMGATSGWVTGFMAMKVGKVVAFSVGGGIILLQVAANQGYIKINWNKIQRNAEKLSDKVEEKLTGEGPKFLDKVERYVDKKLDQAEDLLDRSKSQSRHWYHNFTNKNVFRPTEIHFFAVSFIAGVAIGIATAN